MPRKFERIVTSDTVGEIIGNEHRECGWDDELIKAAICLRIAEKYPGAIDRIGECAVRKRIFSDRSFGRHQPTLSCFGRL